MALGQLEEETLARLEKLCRTWALPVRIPPGFAPEALVEAMRTDKKVIRGRLHFILPVRIGDVIECQDLRAEQLEETLRGLGAG